MAAGLVAALIELLPGLYAGPDRVEPGVFLLWRMPVLAGLALMLVRAPLRGRVAGSAAMLTAAAIGEGWLTGLWGWAPVAVGVVLAVVADLVARAGLAIGGRWLAAGALALLLAVPGGGRQVQRWGADDGMPVVRDGGVAVLAGVPLARAEGVERAAIGDAAGWRLLTQAFAVQGVDRIQDARAGRWLLVQPRAPGAAGLVAIDAGIRAGSRAVILTDSDLRWPSRYPDGDRAAPPRGGTLAPLLLHWGLVLERGAPGLAVRDIGWRGRQWRLALAGAGRFHRIGGKGDCVLHAGGLIARCRIGRGRAWLVADADLLDPALWTDPDGGHAPAFRPSDNAAFVLALLTGDDRINSPVRPVLWTDHGMK